MQGYMTHIAKQGERWDTIAYRYYANPFAYGLLIAANPQLSITPILPAGAVVAVPIVNSSDTLPASDTPVINEELPPWLM